MKQGKTLLVILILFCNVAMTIAQNVSVNFTRVRLEKVLDELSVQTGFSFLHSRPAVNPDELVTLNVSNVSLSSALDKLFAGTEVSYQISEKKVYLYSKHAQTSTEIKKKVRGKIVDADGIPIIGAGVLVKGTTRGTTTDIDGVFSIETSPQEILLFSSLGYDDIEAIVGNRSVFDITLNESSTQLSETVVIGYGVVNKRDVSTAISSIKAEDISGLAISDFRQSMAGKMPGVHIMQTSGDPEGRVNVCVRGVSSATAGNDPLYVVDGVPMDNGLSGINSNDIESLEVLKDASSAAIYGSRGSNGVILITTKKGKSDKVSVSFDSYYGVEQLSKKIDMLDAYQYAQLSKEGHDNAYFDLHPGGTDINGSRPESYSNYPVEFEPYLKGMSGLTNTDWQDEIYRTAKTTNQNLSISGKCNSVNYYISGGFYKKEGIIINSDFTKYSARINLDGKSNKFKYGINFSPSYSKSNRVDASGSYSSGGIVQSALSSTPIWPVYNEDGTFNFQGNGFWRIGNDYQHNEVLNPVALATLQSDVVNRMAITGRGFMSYEIIDGLTFQTSIGGNYYGAHNDKYRSSKLPLLGKAYYGKPSNPVGYSSSGFYFNWLFENQLTYSKDFDAHSLTAVIVQSAQKETYYGNSVEATDYPNDYIQTIDGGTVSKGSSKKTEWSLASYLARVQYSYKGKYMLSAAIRADGSSRFGKNNRWGYFPSASAAWRITGEDFFKNSESLKWINDLKIRTSYGLTGNFEIGNYQHLSTMATDNYILGTGSGSLANGYKPNGISNPDLTWEKTSMVNFGVDISAFKGYLGLTAEYYYSDTHDMLLNVPVPHLTGYSTTLMNIGKVNNRGVEITLTSRHSYSSGLSYSFNSNFAKNINEVKALGANDTPIIKTCSTSHDFFITTVGKPIGSYYLLVQDGIFKNSEELKAYPHFANTQAGDFRFVDVDGDGVLETDDDRAIVGNYMPDFTYGFNGDLAFKGFDLQFAFQGVYGNEILNLNRRYIASVEGNLNMMSVTLNRWKSESEPGDGNTNRANRKAKGNNGRTSTWHIEDGSYLRLQNLSLGYTIPQSLSQKANISKLRLYVSGQNLFTWTKYSGYNPEVSLSSDSLTPGVDYGTYPLARTFMIGLNITF